MTWTSAASGTKTPATLGTEEDLVAATTTNGTYVLVVDTANLVNGEQLDLTIKVKAKSAGTSRIAYAVHYENAQGDPVKFSVPVPVANEIVCRIKQTGGTLRAYDYELLRQ